MAVTSTLAIAVRYRHWELAALCLLVGLAEAAAKLPPDSLSSLLSLLEGAPDREPRR